MRNESSDMTKKKRREEVFRFGKQAEEAGDYEAKYWSEQVEVAEKNYREDLEKKMDANIISIV